MDKQIKAPLLTMQDICKSFGKLEVLKGISLTVSEGEVVAVIGPSGSGKSTLLPKIKLEIVVSSDEWKEKTIAKIQEIARTGEVGDGKIFTYAITDAIKIRTGETGYDALQSAED